MDGSRGEESGVAIELQPTDRIAALRIMDPDGYSKEHLVEKWFRDITVYDIFEGDGADTKGHHQPQHTGTTRLSAPGPAARHGGSRARARGGRM
jgi:hypothetical protein